MPIIKVTGIDKEIVKKVSKSMIDELQETIKCPRDYFTIEVKVNPVFIFDGEEVSPPYFIRVEWFDRGCEVRDKSASIITEAFRKEGISPLDVRFSSSEKECYYEDGMHF